MSMPYFAAISLALMLCLGGQQCMAQNDPAGASPTTMLCNETNSKPFDPKQIAGIWYEVARNPGPPGSLLCAQLNLTMVSSTVMDIAFRYSNTPLYPWVNQSMSASITVNNSNTDGYNISYTMYNHSYPYTVYKLLDTDYKNYAFVCGYTNATDNSTSFGIVLTRQRTPSLTQLDNYEYNASMNYSNFLNGTMTQISQPATCVGGAIATVSTVAVMLVFVYALLALLC